MERIQYASAEERDEALAWLNAPRQGRDPDNVSEDVVAEEMALFHQLRAQNRET